MSAAAESVPLQARLLATVFLPFAAGFFLSFLLRNVNAVISKDLAAEFSLSSSDLGLLTSAYFLSFAAMQIPVGIFLDRYGPRRVTAFLLLVAAAGAGVFALAEGFATLTFGRALIGVGVSCCLMGSMKAFALWFPLERLATLNGWTMAAGALGGLAATVPVEFAASAVGWRAMFGALAVFAATSAACIYSLVPEKPLPGATEGWDEQFGKLATIFGSRLFWRLGLPLFALQGVFQALFGLWLVPWLMDTQGLARSEAAHWLLWAAFTYALASILFGQGADWLAARGIPRLKLMQWGTALGVAGYFGFLFGGPLPKFAMLMVYTLGAIAPALCYAILTRRFPTAVSGRLNTALNVSMFVCAFAAQVGTGFLLGLFPVDGGRYAAEGYALAFAILGVAQLCAWWSVVTLRPEPAAANA